MERRYVALIDDRMGKTAKQITKCLLATYLSISSRTVDHTVLLYISNVYASFQNRVLGRVFGPKRDKVTRDWRKLHSEKLDDLYPSLNIK